MSGRRTIDEVHLDVYRALRDASQVLERKRGERREAVARIFATMQGDERDAAVAAVVQAMLMDIVDEIEKAFPNAQSILH